MPSSLIIKTYGQFSYWYKPSRQRRGTHWRLSCSKVFYSNSMFSCTDFHTFLKSSVQLLNNMWWNEWVHKKEENYLKSECWLYFWWLFVFYILVWCICINKIMTICMPSWQAQRQLSLLYVSPTPNFPLWGVSWEIWGWREGGRRGGEISQGICNQWYLFCERDGVLKCNNAENCRMFN